MHKLLPTLGLIISTSVITPVFAQQKPISGEFNKRLPEGSVLLAVSDNGRSSKGTLTGKKFRVVPPASSARLYILLDDKVIGQVVLAPCKRKRGSKVIDQKTCGRQEVYSSFKAGRKLGILSKVGAVYVLRSTSLAPVITAEKVVATNFIPLGISSYGLGGNRVSGLESVSSLNAAGGDADRDGLVNALDIDDNGNGIIDNYDSSTPAGTSTDSFRVFSNLKLELAQSLNLHATGSLPVAAIDTALQANQTLAIQVAGTGGETTELDCGTLLYCSSGGSGEVSEQPFPGAFGGPFDPDSDGFGTVTRGSTGDFQLQTRATSPTIGAGDTLVQRIISADGTERQIPGVLNFVFNSTPALKTVSVNGGTEQTIDYTVTPRLGSRQRCIQAPATGDVVLTITGWRPQRPGVPSAGEAEFIDIGRSRITIDIPNGPATIGSPPTNPVGPGNCVGSAYTVSSDQNLTITGDGLQDGNADTGAVSTNTYTFTIDLSACLNSARNGVINWSPNSELMIDLQFRSRDGDNAAQKFCVTRAAL